MRLSEIIRIFTHGRMNDSENNFLINIHVHSRPGPWSAYLIELSAFVYRFSLVKRTDNETEPTNEARERSAEREINKSFKFLNERMRSD